ncbi:MULTISPECIES: hypothetical protein [unclassified Ruegeria]|nr:MULTISPECIES: hypothetical protein [unclassified Ruegeria]
MTKSFLKGEVFMKPLAVTAFVFAAMVGFGTGSHAKPLSRIIAEMGLSPADFNVVNATADSMLENGAPPVGTERNWTSQDSGSKGTIRVRDVRDNCVHFQHLIQPEGTEQVREVRTRRCQDAGGAWILTP